MNVNPNKVICDLNKAQWCIFGYVNQHGTFFTPDRKPKFSVHGFPRDPNEKAFGCDLTLKQLADKLGVTDVWTPRIKIMFSSNHYLVYTGEKAKAINSEWNKRIFKKSKQEMKR